MVTCKEECIAAELAQDDGAREHDLRFFTRASIVFWAGFVDFCSKSRSSQMLHLHIISVSKGVLRLCRVGNDILLNAVTMTQPMTVTVT